MFLCMKIFLLLNDRKSQIKGITAWSVLPFLPDKDFWHFSDTFDWGGEFSRHFEIYSRTRLKITMLFLNNLKMNFQEICK